MLTLKRCKLVCIPPRASHTAVQVSALCVFGDKIYTGSADGCVKVGVPWLHYRLHRRLLLLDWCDLLDWCILQLLLWLCCWCLSSSKYVENSDLCVAYWHRVSHTGTVSRILTLCFAYWGSISLTLCDGGEVW